MELYQDGSSPVNPNQVSSNKKSGNVSSLGGVSPCADLPPGGWTGFPVVVQARLKKLGLKPVDIAVGLAVLSHSRSTDPSPEVWPKIPTLAADINTSDDTVSRSPGRWDATGLLPRRRIRKWGGQWGQYAYNVGPLMALMVEDKNAAPILSITRDSDSGADWGRL